MDRPILFKDDMIRAILEGRKTQTRRVVKSIDHDLLNMMCEDIGTGEPDSDRLGLTYGPSTDDDGKNVPEQWLVYCDECPGEGVLTLGQGYGQPGDRLWVRETWWQAGDWFQTHPEDDEYGRWSGSRRVVYAADCNPPNEPNRSYPEGLRGGSFSAADPWRIWRKRPSIHMPRWASRITLEITDVRVERLQDISEEDAKAEGVHGEKEAAAAGLEWYDKPRRAFQFLWRSINGPDSWDANPWVWVVEFRRVD